MAPKAAPPGSPMWAAMEEMLITLPPPRLAISGASARRADDRLTTRARTPANSATSSSNEFGGPHTQPRDERRRARTRCSPTSGVWRQPAAVRSSWARSPSCDQAATSRSSCGRVTLAGVEINRTTAEEPVLDAVLPEQLAELRQRAELMFGPHDRQSYHRRCPPHAAHVAAAGDGGPASGQGRLETAAVGCRPERVESRGSSSAWRAPS